MKSKSQIYSEIVFTKVQDYVAGHTDEKSVKKYKSLNKRAGGVLRTVGLIQFLTFLKAKAPNRDSKEIHHHFLLEHLREELSELEIVRTQDTSELLNNIRGQELPEYMRTTSETLRLLQWHKRISDILISGTAEGD